MSSRPLINITNLNQFCNDLEDPLGISMNVVKILVSNQPCFNRMFNMMQSNQYFNTMTSIFKPGEGNTKIKITR